MRWRFLRILSWCLMAMCAACVGGGPRTHAGCYELEWLSFDAPRPVPPWLVPGVIRLETREVVEGVWRVGGGYEPDTTTYAIATQVPWYRILYDGRWTMRHRDTAVVILADAGISEWTITLSRSGDGYDGAAVFATRLGGPSREINGVVRATPCPDRSP